MFVSFPVWTKMWHLPPFPSCPLQGRFQRFGGCCRLFHSATSILEFPPPRTHLSSACHRRQVASETVATYEATECSGIAHRAVPAVERATAQAETWRGLRVAPESRCSPYVASEYAYRPSIETQIAEQIGGIWSPYTGRTFSSSRDTDIEHIVARSEAHDSGLCAASQETRRRFATDLLNLTLASPDVNRGQKNDRDAAAWVPNRNQCWFADRVVRVRQKYSLTIDRREASALDQVLVSCASTTLVRGWPPVAEPINPGGRSDTLPAEVAQWDDNGNGRITCAEARTHGIAPERRDHPAYAYMRDGDGDGIG